MTANILVVDDLEQNVSLMETRLLTEYYNVYAAYSGLEALEVLANNKIDVVLLDCMMPGMDGFETCRLIKSNPDTTHIPVVIVTALSDVEDRVHGLEVGADEFITKPVDDKSLFSRIKSLVRIKYIIDELKLRNDTNVELGAKTINLYQDFSSGNVMIINDDVVEAKHISNVLSDITENIRCVSDGNMINALFKTGFVPDVTIVSCHLEGQDPLRLVSILRTSEIVSHSPIMMLAEEENMNLVNRALEMGASDYIISPVDKSELIARIKTQLRKKYYQDALRDDLQNGINLAIRDPLSGLYNRRYFDTHLQRSIVKSTKEGRDLYLMMIDIDYFKDINDVYGHLAGDQTIKDVANIISSNIRVEDTVARYGGEEFAVIIYDISEDNVNNIAMRLCDAVEKHSFVVPDSDNILSKTISIGLAKYSESYSLKQFISKADTALYEAKNGGRNKLVYN